MQHHRTADSAMGRRTYLALGAAAVAGAVGVGSVPTTAAADPAPKTPKSVAEKGTIVPFRPRTPT